MSEAATIPCDRCGVASRPDADVRVRFCSGCGLYVCRDCWSLASRMCRSCAPLGTARSHGALALRDTIAASDAAVEVPGRLRPVGPGRVGAAPAPDPATTRSAARAPGERRGVGLAAAAIVLAVGVTVVAVTFAMSTFSPPDQPSGGRAATASGSIAVATAPATVHSTSASVHVVRAGDTLRAIAAEYLGDEQRWPEILDLNRDRVAAPDELRVGMELRLPRP
jgi:nucleoid-associated protein YgaU